MPAIPPTAQKPGDVGAKALRLAPYFKIWWAWNRSVLLNFKFDPRNQNQPILLPIGELAILLIVEDLVSVNPTPIKVEQDIFNWTRIGTHEHSLAARIKAGLFPWHRTQSLYLDEAPLAKLRRSTVPPAISVFCRLIGV